MHMLAHIAMYRLGITTLTRSLCLNDVNFKIACYVANHKFETINFPTIGSQYIHIVNCDNIIYLANI